MKAIEKAVVAAHVASGDTRTTEQRESVTTQIENLKVGVKAGINGVKSFVESEENNDGGKSYYSTLVVKAMVLCNFSF